MTCFSKQRKMPKSSYFEPVFIEKSECLSETERTQLILEIEATKKKF